MDTKLEVHQESNAKTAIVFVHGFGGHQTGTWGAFPALIRDDPALDGFDVYSLGYSTHLAPDIRGVWRADPNLTTLAEYLVTRSKLDGLAGKRLAMIAHSMGGLIVQRALLTDPGFRRRLSHVILFGTPSAGLKKAGLLRWVKPSVRDMGWDSAFVTALRSEWNTAFGPNCMTPFDFTVVAGDMDTFVPTESSLDPFPADKREVVLGDHAQIVKPDSARSLSAQLVVKTIQGKAAPGGRWSAARVALERGEFQEAIDTLLPHADELDEVHLVKLALALDDASRRDESIGILTRSRSGTDAQGVLAGRLKRRWLAEGREADAEAAEALYGEAFETSRLAGHPSQALYHAINLAFMTLAYRREPKRAAELATQVLEYTAQAPADAWRSATEGEAYLYLGEIERALDAYGTAAAEPRLGPRALESMYQQASLVVEAINLPDVQPQLNRIFRGGPNPPT